MAEPAFLHENLFWRNGRIPQQVCFAGGHLHFTEVEQAVINAAVGQDTLSFLRLLAAEKFGPPLEFHFREIREAVWGCLRICKLLMDDEVTFKTRGFIRGKQAEARAGADIGIEDLVSRGEKLAAKLVFEF